jgi:uracil-DNA glycosylase
MAAVAARLKAHQAALGQCHRCPAMIGPVVLGRPVASKIIQIGQAPGPYEGGLGRPFAWTAGKTLFKWYATLGVDEEAFRSRVYMAAVCRCFPGKNPSGGDRVPDRDEIARCGEWLREEVALLKPELIIPVGKLAIAQMLSHERLDDVVGRVHRVDHFGHETDAIPLPHPSGLSTWFKTEPGKTLLGQALSLIGGHPAWRATFAQPGS